MHIERCSAEDSDFRPSLYPLCFIRGNLQLQFKNWTVAILFEFQLTFITPSLGSLMTAGTSLYHHCCGELK
jgi:hypothetical protein